MYISWVRSTTVRFFSIFLIAARYEGSKGNPSEACPANSKLDSTSLLCYPAASDHSMGIVREIFHPFSLETFAKEYFEKKPLVIRRR